MKFVLTFCFVALFFLILLKSKDSWLMYRSQRRRDVLSGKKPTMYDVKRLLQNGERELAVRLYCEIFQTNKKEAQKAVEELERSIHKKNGK